MKLKRIGRGCNLSLFGAGSVRTGDVVELRDEIAEKLLAGDKQGWSKQLDVAVQAEPEPAAPEPTKGKQGMKAFVKALILVASLIAFGAQAQITPSHYMRDVRNLIGTNLNFYATSGQGAALTVTNIAQNLIPTWRYDSCWVWVSGKADGTASGSNISFVFLPVNADGTRTTSGTDAIAKGEHVNLFLGPSSNAVANTVSAWCNLPCTNNVSYTLWMITNAGCNWTNLTLKSYGKVPAN